MGRAVSTRGATLVELVVVLLVAALTLAQAAPALARWVQDARAFGLVAMLLADLQWARSEAIRRGTPVVVCARAGSVCGEGGWEGGWLLFVDDNGNAQLDEGEHLLREAPALPPGWHWRGNQPVDRYVAYHALGQTRLVGGAFQAGTLTLCRQGDTPVKVRRIVINSQGRPRVEEGDPAACAAP
jgi:type IV fimbrial biogenesis protein FimT